MKMTSNRRLPQTLKWKISATNLPQILHFSLYDQNKLCNISNEDDIEWNMNSNGKNPQILRVEYLSNYWSGLPHILNLGLYHQSKLIKYLK